MSPLYRRPVTRQLQRRMGRGMVMMMMGDGSVHSITRLRLTIACTITRTIACTICVKSYSGWLVRGLLLPLLKV